MEAGKAMNRMGFIVRREERERKIQRQELRKGTCMTRFEDLDVWQKGCEIAIGIYEVTAEGKLANDFGLRDQLRRSATSIPSNIAEGKERETVKELIRFLYISKGSAAELKTQLLIAYKIGYLGELTYRTFDDKVHEVSGMLGRFIRTLKSGRGEKSVSRVQSE